MKRDIQVLGFPGNTGLKYTILLAALFAVLLVAAACGGGDDDVPTAVPDAPIPSPSPAPPQAPPTAIPPQTPAPSTPMPAGSPTQVPLAPGVTPVPTLAPPVSSPTSTSPAPVPTPPSTAAPPAPIPPTVAPAGGSVSLSPIKDNTLYEDTGGFKSNGMGEHLFAGNTGGGSTRRAVIAFDVAGAIPAGATITSVTLTLHMSRSQAGPQTITLHTILADWGEGTSDAPANEGGGADSTPGDATWVHRFFEADLWSAMGGDFSQTESASASVGGSGSYAWGSTAPMVADVQGWLNDPATSFGWLLKGNEQSSQTAKRFDSRQNSNEAFRPVLVIEFGP